jgi:aryl-alcohol dehydrogenase (NADP+)
MEHRRLGRTGLRVSPLCLGTMTFGIQCDEQTSVAILDRAADAGVDFLDTADVYPVPMTPETAGGSEEILGRWLKGRRDRFVVGTKCYFPTGNGARDRGLSRRHVLAALDASLRRLQTDYVDLYQVHAFDPETPLEETLSALDSAVRAGKVRYLGCSNFRAWELARALWVSELHDWARFDCVQPRYNLLHREIETELLPLCRDQGVGVIVFNPLAGGVLTGKHDPERTPSEGRFADQMADTATTYRARYWRSVFFERVAELQAFFEPRGVPLATAAIAWVMEQPGITSAILGASRPGQLEQTLAGASYRLDDEEREALDRIWFELPRERPGTGPVR